MPTIIPQRYYRFLTNPITLAVTAAVLLLGGPIYLFQVHWQPENVLERRWNGFLRAAENANARALAGYLSADYQDAWGQDKAEASANAAEVLRSFMSLEIEDRNTLFTYALVQDPPEAKISSELLLDGKPAGYGGQEVLTRSRRILAPWEFLWVKEPGSPWNWKIRRIDNQDLRITPAELEKAREFRSLR